MLKVEDVSSGEENLNSSTMGDKRPLKRAPEQTTLSSIAEGSFVVISFETEIENPSNLLECCNLTLTMKMKLKSYL